MRSLALLLWVGVGCGCATAAPAASTLRAASGDVAIPRERLDVTLGRISALPGGALFVDDAKVRAVAPGVRASAAELHFKYLGPTEKVSKLASGRIRRQLGLKLRARDGCNLVYVMWHVEPTQQVVVEVKRNHGDSRHDECGAGGYTRVKPRRTAKPAVLVPGTEHRLRAELEGQALRVLADGALVWEGELGPEATGLDGPVGLRTDNVRTELRLLAR